MRHLVACAVLCFLAASSVATAQVQVAAQTERTNFLLFERVDLLVTVSNIGDTDLVLDNQEGHPWLSFLLSRHSDHNYAPVHTEMDSTFKPLPLKAGETKTLRVNLTPLFAFRQEGEYRAAAVVDLPGQGQAISENVPFNVINGRTVWSQARPVDGSQRIYSLIRFSPDPNSTELYLRVEDPAANLVYANIGLGELVSFIDPEVFFDPQGNLHILHPIAMGTYLYSRVDPDGKVQIQTTFKTFREIPPRLRKLEDGNVIVMGGMEQNPAGPRETLSQGQLVKQTNPQDVPTALPNAGTPPEDPMK